MQKSKTRTMPQSAAHCGGVGGTADTFVAPDVAQCGHGARCHLWHMFFAASKGMLPLLLQETLLICSSGTFGQNIL